MELTKEQKQFSSAMDDKYQSTFLPIFSHAETKIKELIAKYFWELKSKRLLSETIKKYITEISKKVPKDLPNRQAYIDGLWKKSQKMIDTYYTKAVIKFSVVLGLLVENQTKVGVKMPTIHTPKQMTEYIESKKIKFDMWSQAKGRVAVQNYPQEIAKYINNLSGEVITTYEKGTKGISLWQKAELDVRYSHQMEMLQNLKDNGEDLCWISTHPDCSSRCEKWQGKLVSLTLPSKYSGFRVMKVDGHWVYSLTEIMAQKDKYGYKNNIICGFNCRHTLKPYTPNSYPPKQYEGQDVKKMREINAKIRSIEREIRFYKTQEVIYTKIGDIKKAKLCRKKANELTKFYYEYCNKNGFASLEYRINV